VTKIGFQGQARTGHSGREATVTGSLLASVFIHTRLTLEEENGTGGARSWVTTPRQVFEEAVRLQSFRAREKPLAPIAGYRDIQTLNSGRLANQLNIRQTRDD
jgi:hypothetical protein